MKVLILEDELPAYQKIDAYINSHFPEAELIGWARSNQEALEIYDKLNPPDLIFSDIELLDGLSFDFFEQQTIHCPVIFCTAFDQYLLRAFQTNGISYLLKPFDEEAFGHAIQKFKSLFGDNMSNTLNEQIIANIKEAISGDANRFKKRFTIKKKDGIKLLPVSSIVLIEAAGDFCKIIDHQAKIHTAGYTLSQIEKLLDPSQFFRINRSEIIQIDYIENIEQYFKNRLQITLLGGKYRLTTSGSKTPLFRKWVDS